jgi:hypothetical protein
MTRLPVFLASLLFLGVAWTAIPGGVRKAEAAAAIVQTGEPLLLTVMAHPPARMCVGQKAPAQLMLGGRVTGRVDVTAESANGTLAPLTWHWDYGSQRVFAIGLMMRTQFTATAAGDARITFRVSVAGQSRASVAIGFEVIQCTYEIRISAVETVFAEGEGDVSYQISIEGDGTVDAQDIVSGEGRYSFSLLVHYKVPEQGLTCVSTIPSTGSSTFTIKGSRTDTGLNLSLIPDPVVLGGGKVECEDANGRKTDVPPAFQGKADMSQFPKLENINLAPSQGYAFTFPPKGRGYLYILPAEAA